MDNINEIVTNFLQNTKQFEDDFNSPLDEYINELKEYTGVIFGKHFNQSVDNLPDNIEIISVLHCFNGAGKLYKSAIEKYDQIK